MRILLIVNERAGTGRIRLELTQIVELLMKDDNTVKVFRIEPESGRTAKKALEGDITKWDRIAVAGGDGTLSYVVRELMERNPEERPPIGYIPSGSTNDFARSFGIPFTPTGACRTILEGRPYAYDVGSFNDTWFNYVAAFGAFVPVSYEAKQKYKNVLGHAAYVLRGISTIQENISFSSHVRIEADGKSEEGDYLFGAVYNSTSIGGVKVRRTSMKRLCDGKLEMLLIKRPEEFSEVQEIIRTLHSGEPDSPYITFARVDEVNFVFDEPVPWTLDGEFGGNQVKAGISDNRQAMKVMIPKRRHAEAAQEQTGSAPKEEAQSEN